MELRIRLAEQKDFNPLLGLLRQLWPDLDLDYKDLSDVYLKAVDSKAQQLIVGLVDNKVVGFCSLTIKNNLWQAGSLGHVDELVIDKKFRGKGFGKKMIDSITHIAKNLKCKRIELESAFHRKEAHKFYETIGFQNRAYLFSKKLI